MSKPAAGTLIASNSLTADMVCAYLLNGSLTTSVVGGQNITGLVNSVGGAQPLSANNVNCGALSYDAVTDSLVFTGADFLGLPTGLPIEATGDVSAITVLIGFEGGATATYNTVWEMQTGADQEFDPYVNGHVLSSALSSSRGDYVPPTTAWFSAFNQLGVTGAAGGSLLSYVNGVLANTRAADASIGIGSGPLIGSAFNPFVGKIQFFYAWTRVLSAGELATLAADPYTAIFSAPTSQTITFASIPAHATTDAPFSVTPTASSGLTVSLAVTSGPATISGDVVTLTGATGTVTIQATQAGNGTYAAATPVSQSFAVSVGAQSITFGAIPNHVANDPPFALAPTSSSGLAVSLAVTLGPATIVGNTVTLTGAAGTVTIQATQAGNGTYAAATPVSQSFEVSASQRGNIAYDQIRASDRTGNGPQLLTYTIPAPVSATSAGTPGQVAFDAAGNWYWCYAVNSWARIGPGGYGGAAASPPSW